jgi:hypothetical protein
MDNVLIAEAIAKGKCENINGTDDIKNNKLKKNNPRLSYMSYKLFLQYMEDLRLNKKDYDIKFEIQKYNTWSKNAESTYQ